MKINVPTYVLEKLNNPKYTTDDAGIVDALYRFEARWDFQPREPPIRRFLIGDRRYYHYRFGDLALVEITDLEGTHNWSVQIKHLGITEPVEDLWQLHEILKDHDITLEAIDNGS